MAVYFGEFECKFEVPSDQNGKEGDVAVMGGKGGVLALASVLESPQKKIFEETIFGENGKKSRSWRRRFVRGFWPDGSLNVSSQRATEPQQICAVVKPTVEQPSEEASAELVHAIEVARQAAAIVARAAGKAAAERKEKARAVAKDFKDRETAARVREHQAARKAAAKARKYKDHDGQCWERVGSYATAKAWYFKCLQETQMAKVMPATVAPVVANAVGDSLGAKSAVAKSHKEEAAAVYKARRGVKQAAEDAAISKAQPKASIWGGLLIWLKDQGQIVRRNANARVFYRDMHLITAFPRLQPRNTDQDLALCGELDGIAHKVGQNLPHPP